jgi:glutaconate CoA-transferase, subunit B
MQDYTLAELCITAAAEAWRHDGEVLASGIGLVPRLAASLAKLTFNPALLMTDAECMLVAEPVPVGLRKNGSEPIIEGWMPYARTFDLLWGGKRHAMVGPVQIDRHGQTNISLVGEYARPKSAFLGVRGFPGNTINHANSMFVPAHSTRIFVAGEVDMVGGVGYNPARWPGGRKPAGLDLRIIVTDLAVLDFKGSNHQIRVVSLHPGVGFEHVQESTGFPLARPATLPATPAPTAEQLELIRRVLDPRDLRSTVFKGNPPGVRAGAS